MIKLQWGVLAGITLILSCISARAYNPGTILTCAGNGNPGYSGDGGLAIDALLNWPCGVISDSSGNIYITEWGNHMVRLVNAQTGIITRVAGNGSLGNSGDGGLALNAALNTPRGMVIDSVGNLYVSDRDNHNIRKINLATGIISTIAGTGMAGYSGDGGQARYARLNKPQGLCLDSYGNLYISDSDNNRIRKIDALTGVITTIVGNGYKSFSGDGGQAIHAALDYPADVVTDAVGNLLVIDEGNNRLRKVDRATGIISTIAGDGVNRYAGDGGSALYASFFYPTDIALDQPGNMYIACFYDIRVRKIDAVTGIINTVAGTGIAGYSGDGGPATSAMISYPMGVTLDPVGNLYIAERNSNRIRQVVSESSSIGTAVIPTFSPDGGSFISPVSVIVTCPTPDAVIHYTTNGNDPTESDPAVSSGQSVYVDASMILKARAWAPGVYPSAVKSAYY